MPLPVRWRYKLDRWRSQIAAMFHSEPKTLRPRLCPACGTLVGATATKCHQCGASMTFSLAAASRSLSKLRRLEIIDLAQSSHVQILDKERLEQLAKGGWEL